MGNPAIYDGKFLSTPSARRATGCATASAPACLNFYPRPPRGGRHLADDCEPGEEYISIHALREEGDRRKSPDQRVFADFYPRPPRGGRLLLR